MKTDTQFAALAAVLLAAVSRGAPSAANGHGNPQSIDSMRDLRTDRPPAFARAVPLIDPETVYFDAPGDGSLWARGRLYKAKFDANGAKYIPFLGSCEPVNHPVLFSLESVAVGGENLAFDAQTKPTRSESTISYDRGSFLESYRLLPDSMEQLFVFESLPSEGDIVVRMGVGTTLAFSDTPEGFRFAKGASFVQYGKAVAIDAEGARAPAATTWEDGSIEIRVPDAFLATAALPVTIDPLVTTFFPDVDPAYDDFAPDVSYESGSDHYLFVYEEAFSAVDHDVWSLEYDSSGVRVPSSGGYIDITDVTWISPRTASSNRYGTHMVVAQRGENPNDFYEGPGIWGRRRTAGSTDMDDQFPISDPVGDSDGFEQVHPDIGGDPSDLDSAGLEWHYMVTWEAYLWPSDHDIIGQLAECSLSGGLAGGTIYLDISTENDQNATISKSNGNASTVSSLATQRWTLVWDRDVDHDGTNRDIYGLQLDRDGVVVHPTFPIHTTLDDRTFPMASSPTDEVDGATREYMVVYLRDEGGRHDVFGRMMNETTVLTIDADLSVLDGSDRGAADHRYPAVDCDGSCYAVVHAEQANLSPSNYDVFVSSYQRVGPFVSCSEQHVNLAASLTFEGHPQIAFASGSANPAFCAVWEDIVGANDGDIEAALYTSVCPPPTIPPNPPWTARRAAIRRPPPQGINHP
jgi:hypothetical protein